MPAKRFQRACLSLSGRRRSIDHGPFPVGLPRRSQSHSARSKSRSGRLQFLRRLRVHRQRFALSRRHNTRPSDPECCPARTENLRASPAKSASGRTAGLRRQGTSVVACCSAQCCVQLSHPSAKTACRKSHRLCQPSRPAETPLRTRPRLVRVLRLPPSRRRRLRVLRLPPSRRRRLRVLRLPPSRRRRLRWVILPAPAAGR